MNYTDNRGKSHRLKEKEKRTKKWRQAAILRETKGGKTFHKNMTKTKL